MLLQVYFYHVYALNAIHCFVNYKFSNIYKYQSYTNKLVIQIENVLNLGYSGHLSIVVSFGSFPWMTTMDRLDCISIRF